jgi:hypothetical protein
VNDAPQPDASAKDWLPFLRDSTWVASAVVAVTSLWAGWAFARHQEVWMDETTQLSGLHLGPIAIVRWLLGESRDRFGGIPGDRMPPVSYLLQWAWSRVFGLSEGALRAFSVLIVALAAVTLARAAARTWGGWSGWIAGLTFALSPNAVLAAADIRAYPFLVLWSACAFSFLLRLFREADGTDGASPAARTWVGLVLSCLAAAYTHFFGIVLTGAVLVGCAWFAASRRAMWRPLLVSAVAVAVGECGVLPFILSAVDISKIALPRSEIPRAAVRLAYRSLGGHPAWSAYVPVLALGLAGGTAVIVVALARRHGAPAVARALVVAVVAGLGAALLARIVTGSFDGLSASYNLWAVPAVVLAGASAVAARDRVLHRAGWTGAVLLLGANLAATCVLAWHGEAYAHSASDRVSAELATMGAPADIVVVHDGSGRWDHAYFPLRYEFGESLQQYLAERQPDGTLALRHLPERGAPQPIASIVARRVVLIDFENMGAERVARYVRSREAPELGDGRVRKAFEALDWSPVQSETLMALGAEHLDVLERRRPRDLP